MGVGIFRRRRGADPGEQAPVPGETAEQAPAPEEADAAEQAPAREEADAADRTRVSLEADGDLVEDSADEGAEPQEAGASEAPHDGGPFDADEVAPHVDRLDLGSLRIPPAEELQLQLELDEATGTVTAVRLLLGASSAQLQVFAAPRTDALWRQVRTEIAEGVEKQGGSATPSAGPLGTELAVSLPGGGQPLRFLGVDGPRWLLRVVLSGPAAVDDAAAAPLLDVVRGTVVVRGPEARAPRELLPLRLPAVEPEASAPDPAEQRSALDPFSRGPEITEVR